MNTTHSEVTGKIYVLPLTREQEWYVSKCTQITRPDRNNHFKILKSAALNLSDEDIMLCCGYHPAGYGNPFNHKETDTHIEFDCYGSCD